MDIRKLQRAIVDGLEDVKGQHIAVFNTEHLSPLFERVIIASGTSNRQTKALASSVRDAVKKGGMQVLRTEGEENGEWIIVDCGAAVAHIMQPAVREYYHLEEIWGGKNVKMKVGATDTKLVKASEPERAAPSRGKAATEVKVSAKPAPKKRFVSKPAGVSKPSAGAKLTPAQTVAAKAANKAAARRRVTPRTPSKTSAAKTATAKTAAKPARKTPSRKA
jgi:ribosome-associated protein